MREGQPKPAFTAGNRWRRLSLSQCLERSEGVGGWLSIVRTNGMQRYELSTSLSGGER